MPSLRQAPFLCAALLALALSACGGDSGAPEVASLGNAGAQTTEDASDTASADPQQAMIDYAQCLRDEGFDVPDPDFGGGPGAGGARGGLFLQAGIDPSDPEFQAAREACSEHLEGLRQQFERGGSQEEFQERALETAQCLRDEGFDVPDPDFSGGGPGGGGGGGAIFGGEFDPGDPDFRAALEKCRPDFGPGGPLGDDEETQQ